MSERRLSGRLSRWLLAGLGVAALLVVLDAAARYGAERWALGEVRAGAEAAALFRAAMLRSEIEKQRTLPVILAQDPDVRAALEERDPARLSALNAKLEALAAATRAGVIYVIDARGIAIAASNYRLPISFVGNDYAFRPYFTRSMAEGSFEHFALGTVSHKPGLYIASRIGAAAQPLGVVVAKAEFDDVEADWRRAADPTFVTDPRDIVLVTSVPDWRFRATVPVPAEQREAIRASLQFGDASLDLLPLRSEAGSGLVEWPQASGERVFVEASAPVPTIPWTLHVLEPVSATRQLARLAARLIALLVGLAAIGAATIWLIRRRRLEDERRQQASMRRELESRVGERTAELRDANDRLREEMEERRRAEAAARSAQDDLAQASKLALLGQIAASVAHEVNQPVAAIRTFADNGDRLIEAGRLDTARGNFATIASLTERIGAITSEMRAFARKSPAAIGPVALRPAIEGALLLVGHRLRQNAIDLVLDLPVEEVTVKAERWRLEQVLVNLLQNAIEALAGRDEARIRLTVRATAATVDLSVADNGSGLSQTVLDNLFVPFTTTKPDGLGLGLVISHDIVAEFGGTLAARNDGGAVFTLTLPRLA
ncbi:sensor histidine kinase [Ancylobacter oerskovii]|uniref:histidine kinase n=1 Tax=Ancylobacter oerskovii TaxID=459519 RepID=A0ABW4Z196_9HYPH|nr:ATP-binding protein [Ancylobacter oerskovii]MBS7545041.1 sensor histidine kinase [Ancylobacter oerskovii]